MATRGELSERILRLAYNGTPPNDASIDIREVGLHVNSAIAFLAKVNYTENYKFESTSYVNDQFVSTFTGNTIHTDATLGLKYCDLPADPIGLPKNRDAGNNDGWNFSLSPPYATYEPPIIIRSFTQPRRF